MIPRPGTVATAVALVIAAGSAICRAQSVPRAVVLGPASASAGYVLGIDSNGIRLDEGWGTTSRLGIDSLKRVTIIRDRELHVPIAATLGGLYAGGILAGLTIEQNTNYNVRQSVENVLLAGLLVGAATGAAISLAINDETVSTTFDVRDPAEYRVLIEHLEAKASRRQWSVLVASSVATTLDDGGRGGNPVGRRFVIDSDIRSPVAQAIHRIDLARRVGTSVDAGLGYARLDRAWRSLTFEWGTYDSPDRDFGSVVEEMSGSVIVARVGYGFGSSEPALRVWGGIGASMQSFESSVTGATGNELPLGRFQDIEQWGPAAAMGADLQLNPSSPVRFGFSLDWIIAPTLEVPHDPRMRIDDRAIDLSTVGIGVVVGFGF